MKRANARAESIPRGTGRGERSLKKTGSLRRLTPDEAFIGLLIAAMDANRHVSREEAARAHHIIWSMKRFRRKSGDTVGRLIETMRAIVEAHGASATIVAASRGIPRGLKSAAFALSADLVLVDGRIDSAEKRFLDVLAERLGLAADTRDGLRDAMLVKNSA